MEERDVAAEELLAAEERLEATLAAVTAAAAAVFFVCFCVCRRVPTCLCGWVRGVGRQALPL